MTAKDVKPLELYDLQSSFIPRRSRLYPLEPIGLETSMVESLTSYITRLANTHCILPVNLIVQEIAPILEIHLLAHQEKGFRVSVKYLDAIFSFNAALDGIGDVTLAWIEAIEQLTLLQKLDRLTMLSTSSDLSPRIINPKFQRWCPYCYQDWLNHRQSVYEPLLWSHKEVKQCSIHGKDLCFQCPHCQSHIYLLSNRPKSGFCPLCWGWLGLQKCQTIQDSPRHYR